jgi:hypothetical protein
LAGYSLISQTRRRRPGIAAAVVIRKNITQFIWSASHPAPDEKRVRANAMNDDSSAYCVAV